MAIELSDVKRISQFVYEKPRTIQEIAQLIGRNWRTAESYVQQISTQMGTICIRGFREGTRGALKVVYWNNTEPVNMTSAQELLMRRIETSRKKYDVSPLDIYQYVDKDKRSSFFGEHSREKINIKQDLVGTFRKAKKQILIFSGDFSWANLVQERTKLIDVFEEMARKGVHISVLANININSAENVRKAMALNEIIGKDMIEVRHCEQPLRAYVIDDRFARFLERKDSEVQGSPGERRKYIFYEINEESWVNWLEKVFWRFFSSSIPAKKRMEDLRTMQRI
jgi:hypothetical protein